MQEQFYMEDGVLIRYDGKDSYAAGTLIPSFSPEELIGGILTYPFSSALIGIGTHEQVTAAMSMKYPAVDMDFEEVICRLNDSFSPIPCDRCQLCVCPHGHEVHMLFREYNYSFLGKKAWAEHKMAMNIQKIYNDCMHCDSWACINHCQRNICIPSQVEKIWEYMKSNRAESLHFQHGHHPKMYPYKTRSGMFHPERQFFISGGGRDLNPPC